MDVGDGADGAVGVGVYVTFTGHGLGGVCEVLCEKPFVRRPTGITAKEVLLSDEARLAATPFGCGQCLPCRINKSRIWQHRILLESMVHDRSAFITLTYSDEKLPEGGNLVPLHVTNFLKRLRYHLNERRIRYFMVGEYGERSGRPHYHGALFNVDFDGDLEAIERAWWDEDGPLGFVLAGDVTKDSATYMVGYAVKGWTSRRINKLNGRHPEFMRCSKGSKEYPGGLGIGAIKQIARRLKGKDVGVVRKLRRGLRDYPLGRYLSQKLADEMGISRERLKDEFHVWQEEFMGEHINAQIPIDSYMASIDGKLRRINARHKFFRKGKVL